MTGYYTPRVVSPQDHPRPWAESANAIQHSRPVRLGWWRSIIGLFARGAK